MSLKKTTYLAACISTLLVPMTASAGWPHGFIDYRHEYLSEARKHYDRVMFGNFFENGVGVLAELRYNSKEGRKDTWDPSSLNNNGMGLSFVYKFRPLDDNKLWLEPMFWLDSSTWWTTYEYGMSAGYDFSREWRVSGRFRYDMDKTTSYNSSEDRNNKRYDLWLNYRPAESNFRYQVNFVYYDNDYLTWNNGNTNYNLDFKVGYKVGSWEPYVRIADRQGVDRTSDDRQIRYRAGITYSW